MKKAITILLALVMVLPLAACGGGGSSSDKKRLIGNWYTESSDAVNTAIGTLAYKNTTWYYFHDNNKYYFSSVQNSYMKTGDGWIPFGDEQYNTYSGTYKLKDGIISLTHKNSSGETETEEIPYYINEYTKELIFDVDKNGNSKWTKSSDTPSIPKEAEKENDNSSNSAKSSGDAKAAAAIVKE